MSNTTPSSNDLMSQLRDIHTPDPVSWWPLAPGWWILMLLVIGAIVTLFILFKRSRQPSPSLAYAEQQLQLLQSKSSNKENLVEALHLLRRFAMSHFPKELTARMPLLTLAKTIAATNQITLNSSSLKLLNNAHYAPNVSVSNEQWLDLLNDLKQLIQSLNRVTQQPATQVAMVNALKQAGEANV